MSGAELTVIANVALDRVNGSAWRAGGCPTFAPAVFRYLRARGTIYASCADADRGYFHALEHEPLLTCSFIGTASTSRFALDYFGVDRTMRVHALGHQWSPADIASLNIETEWVHLAPLTRADFPPATVASLAAQGHRISYDGQGLVRAPQIGKLTLDDRYERSLLKSLTVLKLSEQEAEVLTVSGDWDGLLAELREIPELILTQGPGGAEIWSSASMSRVAPGRVVQNVQTTGAGDAFMMSYLIGRHRGRFPREAAVLAAEVTAAILTERRGDLPARHRRSAY